MTPFSLTFWRLIISILGLLPSEQKVFYRLVPQNTFLNYYSKSRCQSYEELEFPTQVMLFVFIPIMMPAVISFGIDPVHFGIVAIVNLMIGLNTPPFGLQLFVASGVLKVSVRDILKESWPMLICLMVVLLLITYIEPLVMFLPRFLSY